MKNILICIAILLAYPAMAQVILPVHHVSKIKAENPDNQLESLFRKNKKEVKADTSITKKDSLQVAVMKDSTCSCCEKIILKLLDKDSQDEKTAESTDDNDYPMVHISGSGSLSGNIDSSIAAAGRLQLLFQPNSRLSVYGSINIGQKTDTLKITEIPPAKPLLFPDANRLGFILGGTYQIRIADVPGRNKFMQFNVSPLAEFSLQNRSFIFKDTANSVARSFFSSNILIGGKLEMSFTAGKNTAGLECSSGWSFLNIANNDLTDYRIIYSGLVQQPGGEIPDRLQGLFFQAVFKVNNLGLYYRYANLNAKDGTVISGLTGGQHFFGLQFTANILTW